MQEAGHDAKSMLQLQFAFLIFLSEVKQLLFYEKSQVLSPISAIFTSECSHQMRREFNAGSQRHHCCSSLLSLQQRAVVVHSFAVNSPENSPLYSYMGLIRHYTDFVQGSAAFPLKTSVKDTPSSR